MRLEGEGVDLAFVKGWEEFVDLPNDRLKSFDMVIVDNAPANAKVQIVRHLKKIKSIPVLFFTPIAVEDKVRTRGPVSAPAPAAAKLGTEEEMMEVARRFIDDNFQRQLTLEQIAAQAKVSPSYFCRKFKTCFGKSPISYLRKLRIERARHLLAHTRMPLANVCAESGFLSVSYFCREFKKAVKKTPIQYRRAQRGA